jgi:hypothetical protein
MGLCVRLGGIVKGLPPLTEIPRLWVAWWGIAGHGAAPILAFSAKIGILGGERYISTFLSFRAITTTFNCSVPEQSIHSKSSERLR